MKGNDLLDAQVAVLQGGESLTVFDVEQVLGAGDRSVAENYSANQALENLVEAVAWSIAYEVSPRGARGTLLDIGKREGIKRAIQLLYDCRELSLAEEMKYSTLGKIRANFGRLGRRPEFCRHIY